jgi:diaminopimelate decarboxylase
VRADALAQILPTSAGYGPDGRLTIGGCALADVADAAGTPALVLDEGELRASAREYLGAFRSRRADAAVYFASKALSCSAVIAVMADEGLGCDVSSAGELAIALTGGMPAERILMHGNAKRDIDLSAALDAGVGLIVIDSLDELTRLQRLLDAGRPDTPQRVLLRVNPGVTAPTHAAMATGDESSKFGLDIDALRAAAAEVAASARLTFDGLHVHIGSQITELEPFIQSVISLGDAGLDVGSVVDLGGGLGVRYTVDGSGVPSIDEYAQALLGAADRALPPSAAVLVEPGRSLVARAMVTVYRVVSVKRTTRTFVSVDGGMADNLEPMMYGTPFAPFVLDSDRPLEPCDVVGPHCETGDRLVEHWPLAGPRVDDLLAVPMTGAYCYALANNYNGALRPPVVMCRGGEARVVQRRETIDDLLRRNCDVALSLPQRQTAVAGS